MNEIVEDILEYFAAPKIDLANDGGEDWDPEAVGVIEMALAAARAEGAREMRERCAMLVLDWADDQVKCAAAISDLPETP